MLRESLSFLMDQDSQYGGSLCGSISGTHRVTLGKIDNPVSLKILLVIKSEVLDKKGYLYRGAG